MKVNQVLPRLVNAIPFYPELVPVCGSVNATLLFIQMLYWTGKQRDPHGWIFKRAKPVKREDRDEADNPAYQSLAEEVGMTYREERTARGLLRERGLVEQRYDRLGHKLFIRVNFAGLRRRADELGFGPVRMPDPAGDESLPREGPNQYQAGDKAAPGRRRIRASLKGTSIDHAKTTPVSAADAAQGALRLQEGGMQNPGSGAAPSFPALGLQREREGARAEATSAFELALGVRGWPWSAGPAWASLADLLSSVWSEDPDIFAEFAAWVGKEGRYAGINALQIRRHPQQFVDTTWPMFLASRKPKARNPEQPASDLRQSLCEWEEPNGVKHRSGG